MNTVYWDKFKLSAFPFSDRAFLVSTLALLGNSGFYSPFSTKPQTNIFESVINEYIPRRKATLNDHWMTKNDHKELPRYDLKYVHPI